MSSPFLKASSNQLLLRYSYVLLFLFIYGCGSPHLTSYQPDTIVMALSSFPTNLDPRIGLDAASEDFHNLIFNGLLRKDAQGRMVPDACSRFEKITLLRYRFYLRPGIFFHDGKPMSAEDVVYTYESILKGSILTTKKAALGSVVTVRSVGEDIVEMELSEPFNGLLVNLNVGIVPKGAKSDFARTPIGTGPYVLRSYRQDAEAVLEANQKYFDGAPRTRFLRIRMISDATTRALELQKGSLDLVMGAVIVPPDHYSVLKNQPHLKTILSPGNNYSYLGFNMKDGLLKDRRVRQAIGYAIDREEIVRKLYHGAATRASGLLAPHHWSYEKDVLILSHDPGKAKALLNEAGHPDPDGEGPKMRFYLTHKSSTNEFRRMLASVFQSQLKTVGIGLKVRTYEFGTFFSDINRGNFQMFMLTWIGESDPDIYRNIFSTNGTRNRGKYSDPQIDRWVEGARTAETEDQQKYFYSLIQKKVAEDCPYVSLWYENNVAVFRKEMQGFELTPNADVRLLKNVYWSPS
ncbi:ABC transporter substrate-binding protein [bacterium]|nr:ABC transporter substrate-binding protein [bacterium]